MATVSDSSVKPTTIVGADSRFGSTFLSTKYRKHAVAGEVLMDKTTGEIFIKRASDGQLVSFYQNKKPINDVAFDLSILLLNEESFKYPSTNNNAFYISANYDLNSFNDETLYNLITDDISLSTSSNDSGSLTFNISPYSSGFFFRHTTRDIDKAFIEFISSQYNTIIQNYTGDDPAYLVEKQKFSNPNWVECNARISYSGTAYSKPGMPGPGQDTYIMGYKNIVMNEDNVINISLSSPSKYKDIDITIESISYDKLHFMINHKDEFGDEFISAYNKFMPSDNTIGVSECIVSYFVDDISNIAIHGNENIIALLDIPHITRYMDKMTKLFESRAGTSIEISDSQPDKACLWFKPSPIVTV